MFQEQGICQRAFLHYGCCVPSSVYGRLLEWRQHGVKRRHGKYMDKYQMSTPNYERFKFPGVKSIDTYIHIYNYIYINYIHTYHIYIYYVIYIHFNYVEPCAQPLTLSSLREERRDPRSQLARESRSPMASQQHVVHIHQIVVLQLFYNCNHRFIIL